MPRYVEECLKDYNISDSVATPATNDLFIRKDEGDMLSEDDATKFRSVTAKLLYLSKRTRPDLLTLVSYLTTVAASPTKSDQAKIIRGLRYLYGTRDLGVRLSADIPIGVKAFVDASFGTHLDAKSHTGLVISLGGGPIYAKSTKQKLVTRSSAESELVALSDSATQVIWTRDFLMGQGYKLTAANIYEDNKATIELARPGRHNNPQSLSRHINIKHYFIKDRQEAGEVQISYLPTNDMIADCLTKPLQGERFRALRSALLNWQLH